MGGRAVEGTGLENRQRLTPLVGSNPTPSAIARLSLPQNADVNSLYGAKSATFPKIPEDSSNFLQIT